MATKLDGEELHNLYNFTWTCVHDLVDRLLADLDEEQAEALRQKLTDEFRFWKRSA